jgi:uncharacterized protein
MLTRIIFRPRLFGSPKLFLSSSSFHIHILILITVIAALTAGCTSALVPSTSASKDSKRPANTKRILKENATPNEKIIFGSVEQTSYTFTYDPSYVKIDYPMGDVPLDKGVCADVVVRAFRKAGIDLQKEVHEDMAHNFSAYPNRWGARRPDKNIDHRRVANLMTFFERKGKALDTSKDPKAYLPGDVVAWELDNGLLHIGMVIDEKDEGSRNYKIVHNIGQGARSEDVLFEWKIIGHYRFFPEKAKKN